MKVIPCLVFLLVSFCCFSQVEFELGYIVDNAGNRTKCYIENKDWKNNPVKFNYKISEQGEVLLGTLSNVSEFGISDILRFQRKKVEIEQSSDLTSELSTKRAPEFKKQLVFLRTLVEGKASLYLFENGTLRNFLYKKNQDSITPLIYKRYRIEGSVGANLQFQQQLYSNLSCNGNTGPKVQKLAYKESDLVRFFASFNSCAGVEQKHYQKQSSKAMLNLSIRIGAQLSNFEVNRNMLFLSGVSRPVDLDFGNNFSPRFGLELEVVLPYNKNKWALFADPFYQKYASEVDFVQVINMNNINSNAMINYTAVELPLGIRHYFFLNDNSQIFLNASLALVFNSNSEILFETESALG